MANSNGISFGEKAITESLCFLGVRMDGELGKGHQMKCKAVLGLGVTLTVVACVLTGCPSLPAGGNSIVGRWRIYVHYAGVQEASTGVCNFYTDGSCDMNRLGGGTISGTWRTRADGKVVVDFADSAYTTDGLLRQDMTLTLEVNGDELTGTARAVVCLDLECGEGNGTAEGVRIAKSESLLSETPTSAPHGVMGPLESLVNERFSLVP